MKPKNFAPSRWLRTYVSIVFVQYQGPKDKQAFNCVALTSETLNLLEGSHTHTHIHTRAHVHTHARTERQRDRERETE